MPVSLTFSSDHPRTLDRRVRQIDVSHGSLLVTETDHPVLVRADESFKAPNTANLTLYSPNGATAAVTYFDEHAEVPDRGQLELEVLQSEKIRDRIADQETNGAQAAALSAAEARLHQAERLLDSYYPGATDEIERDSDDSPEEKKPSKKPAKKKAKPKTKRKSKASRGDSGGHSGGSYDSRPLKELQALAKERGLTGVSKLPKDKLIKELRS